MYPDPILRKTSKQIENPDYHTETIAEVMLQLMYKLNGAGLAAIQIGVPWRMIAIDIPEYSGVLINPMVWVGDEIYKPHSKAEVMDVGIEGCLSMPTVEVNMPRHRRIKISAMGMDGKHFERELVGHSARVVQHEMDHLDGVLTVDYHDNIAVKEQAKKAVRRFVKRNRGPWA